MKPQFRIQCLAYFKEIKDYKADYISAKLDGEKVRGPLIMLINALAELMDFNAMNMGKYGWRQNVLAREYIRYYALYMENHE
jgi:hypothetical protein